jgi:plasmid stability protein
MSYIDTYGKDPGVPKDELDALRAEAKRSGRSVAALVREAIRKVVLKPEASGPVALWDGEL